MPKVIFVNRFFFPDESATSQMLSDVAFSLAEMGHEVQVITSQLVYEGGRRLAPREVVQGVNVVRVSSTSFGRHKLLSRALDSVSFLRNVRAELELLVAPGDIVVAKTDPPMLSYAVAGPVVRRRAHLVNWIQDVFPEIAETAKVLPAAAPLFRVLRRLRNSTLALAKANVVIGSDMKAVIQSQPGVDPQSLRVIPNWADRSAIFPVSTGNSRLRAKLGLSEKFLVGYSGNLGRVHDWATLLGAIESLSGDSSIHFLFVGGGKKLLELRQGASRGTLPNVTFAPYQPKDQLADSLGAVDVHLCSLSPEFEGLVVPSKLYGIMAAARPCLYVGDTSREIATFIRDEGIGAAVESGDVPTLVAAIRFMRDHPRDRMDMGRRAVACFEDRYDRGIAVGRWDQLLRALSASQ